MYWISLIMLIVLGALAAAPRLAAGRPDAGKLLASVRPWQEWIGVVGLVVGLVGVIDVLIHIGAIKVAFFSWIMALVVALLVALLGFLLSFPFLARTLFSRGSADARQKADDAYERLSPYQVSLGMSALLTAVLSLIVTIIG